MVCQGCGKEINFIMMQSGKKMPVDVAPIYYEDQERGTKKVITADGRVSKGREAIVFSAGAKKAYMSHFATCPAAEHFRRK